jgi:hypothetical protein
MKCFLCFLVSFAPAAAFASQHDGSAGGLAGVGCPPGWVPDGLGSCQYVPAGLSPDPDPCTQYGFGCSPAPDDDDDDDRDGRGPDRGGQGNDNDDDGVSCAAQIWDTTVSGAGCVGAGAVAGGTEGLAFKLAIVACVDFGAEAGRAIVKCFGWP